MVISIRNLIDILEIFKDENIPGQDAIYLKKEDSCFWIGELEERAQETRVWEHRWPLVSLLLSKPKWQQESEFPQGHRKSTVLRVSRPGFQCWQAPSCCQGAGSAFASPCLFAHWLMGSNDGHPISQQCENPVRGVHHLERLKCYRNVRLLKSTASSLFAVLMFICFSVLWAGKIALRMWGIWLQH